MRATIVFVSLFVFATASAQKRYKEPMDAVRALTRAAAKDDTGALLKILGDNARDLVSSGDPVQDRNVRRTFAKAAAKRTQLEKLDSGEMVVHTGQDGWPLGIPLAKDERGWYFDTDAGHQEMLNRRIGKNELDTIQTARVYVDAQNQFASSQGYYAQKFQSEPGKRDGLHWEGEDSPLGPLVASAAREGYSLPGSPYHGYYFRILTAQGPAAPGGPHSYVEHGRMTRGFALVAYPAQPGVSGVMTFIVGPTGIVYQKNLGPRTIELVGAMERFNPDTTWTPVRD